MKIYYWKGKPNFGDALAPLLVEHFCGLPTEWAEPKHAELIVSGSILEHMPHDWSGVVAGVGKMHETTDPSLYRAKILALRGPLTASSELSYDYVIGDPGLLADELVEAQDKIYDLGIVPHWTDKDLEHNPTFTKYNPKIIRVTDDPLKVIREIGQCKKIVSSSLHGIILADAFGIPRRTEIAPKMLSLPKQEGGYFKWMDYNASIGMPFLVGVTQEADRNKITDKQHELFDVFSEITRIFS